MRLTLVINPRRIGLILGGLALYFALQSLLAEHLIENVLDNTLYRSLVLTIDLFSVNAEQTIPTWYSVLLLAGAALLLLWIALCQWSAMNRYWRYWVGLALLFVYLSMDEGAAIHEIVADGLQTTLNLTGFWTFGWQLVAFPMVAVLALLYARFVLHLPHRTRNYFILSAVLFIGGGMVVEGISAAQYALGGVTFPYLAIATIEELGEMLGSVVLITALLDYANGQGYSLTTAFSPPTISTADSAPAEAAFPSLLNRQRIIKTALLIATLNAVLVIWAYSTPQPVPAVPQTPDDPAKVALDRLVTNAVLTTRFVHPFGINHPETLRIAATLLDLYDEVLVVTLPESGFSIALAADDLPFDYDQISGALRDAGVAQYVIYDTPAVLTLVGLTP